MISTKGRYALRLMINLALYSDGNYVRLKDISEKEEISIKYLEQVVALLYKSNLVLSLRGNNGGYKLARDPKDYTAGEILRAAEGTLSPVQCQVIPTRTKIGAISVRFKAMSCPVMVVPMFAPSIMPTDSVMVISPAFTKVTTITVVAPDD